MRKELINKMKKRGYELKDEFNLRNETSFIFDKEFKAKYESQLKYISLEDFHNYLIHRYESENYDFETFESIVLDYIEDAKAWEDWEKKNPNYTDEEEKGFDKECDMMCDKMAAILYKEN